MNYQNVLRLSTLFLLSPYILGECNFDKIQLPADSLPHTSLRYGTRLRTRDLQQRCQSGAWKPIRIRAHFAPMASLTNHDKFRLHTVVERAVQRIGNLLSVLPVVGPLLLSRKKACGGVHASGPNQGKCASIRPGYQTEFCANKVDNFQIPDQHLMGVDVYDESNSISSADKSLPSGPGVENADYILYITAQRSDLCLVENIIAYASYCQLDQNDRPIAGLVNFCPTHLKTVQFSHSKSYLSVIHEVFHALGFSSDLFPKYKECSDRGHCFPWKRIVVEDGDTKRIVLPSVIGQMQRHFNCTEEVGAPLEFTDGKMVGSHWDPLVLQNSIMSPHISESQLMAVDKITLAAFDDMGFYRANYSAADDYDWALGSGCEFIKSPQCTDYSCPAFLCDLRNEVNASGCDYHHISVSMCSAVSTHHRNVGIFKRLPQGRCQQGKEAEACFVSSVHQTKEGQCMQYQCLGNELQVLVNQKWIPCPYKSHLFVEELEQNITCPTSDFLCKTEHDTDGFQHMDFSGGVALWIKIHAPTPSAIRAINGSDERVKSEAVTEMRRTTNVPFNWINRTILLAQERYVLGVLLVPSSDATKEEIDIIYHKMHQLTGSEGLNFSYVTTGRPKKRRPNEPPWPFQNLRGVYILMFMLGVVFVVVIVAAIGTTVIQFAVGRPMVTRSRHQRELDPVVH